MKILLMGGTDLSLVVAESILRTPATLAGIVGIAQQFSISYSKGGVTNQRFADVGSFARAHDIPFVETTNTDEIIDFAGQTDADFCIAAGWYHMVPGRLRSRFRHGTLGIHASLLPKLRGGAPLNWAILSGRRETGVTLFELGDGVDDGNIYAQGRIPIHENTTIGELVVQSQSIAAVLLENVIPKVMAGFRPTPQSQEDEPSYCLQRSPEDGIIPWDKPAYQIARLARAVSKPYGGATSVLDGKQVTIWAARPAANAPEVLGAVGQIASIPGFGPLAVTGDGLLEILDAEIEGNDALPILRKANNKRFRAT